jgi:hypothetical protein
MAENQELFANLVAKAPPAPSNAPVSLGGNKFLRAAYFQNLECMLYTVLPVWQNWRWRRRGESGNGKGRVCCPRATV